MKIPAHESGVIRLFAVDLPDSKIDSFSADTGTDWPLKTALGATDLNPTGVEVFPVSDLEGLGLEGYLIQGNEVPADQVTPMRAQLAQITGHVAVVYSSAFGRSQQHLNPVAPLRHIATFFTEGMPVTFEKLPDDSADLGSGHDEIKPAKKELSQAAMSGRIATFALLFMFAFTGLIIWIGS